MVSSGTNGQVISVLCVDDEPSLLTITRKILERSGNLVVTTATSAAEAIQLLSSGSYDAIVSDYMMPEMDGIAFLKHIRAGGDRTPFIIFSGKGREEVVIEALNSGADFYLQKGGDPKAQFAELANKITYAVGRRRAEIALERQHTQLLASHAQLAAIEEDLRSSYHDLAVSREQIREREQRSAAMIQFLPDATFVIDTAGTVVAWNRAMEEMTGIPASAMIGRGSYEYALPFYGERRPILIDLALNSDDVLLERYTNVQRIGATLEGETVLARPQGRERILWGRASPLYDPDGRTTGAIESIRDVTDQRHAEKALEKSEERYRSVSTVISDIAFSCIRADDGEYRIDWMTGAVPRTTGYSSDEVIAMGCWRNLVHPADLDTFDANILALPPGEAADCQLRIVRKDGEIRWLAVSTRAVRDTEGRTRIYGGCRDITEAKRASDEVRIGHDRLEGAMEAGDIAWWEMDCTTGAVTFSARKAAMLGYPAEQFSHYTDFTMLLHPDDHERAMQAMRDHLDGHAPRYEVEYRIRAADGTYRWFSDTGRVTERDDAGNPAIVTGLVGNITGRKHAAEALRESEERYRIITGNMTETISIMDLSLRFTYVSPSITALRGYSVEEAMGQSLEEVLTPECIPIAKQAFEAAMQQEASGNPVQAVTLDFEEYRKDGSTIWVNNTMTFLRDSAGKATAILIVGRDITEQRNAEAALRESELFNRTLVENLPDYVLVYGMDGRIIHITPPAAAALGYRIDEVVRENLLSFVAEECRDTVTRTLADRIQGNVIPPYEMELVTRTGDRVSVIVKGVRIRYHDTPAVLLVLTDITERKEAEAALRKSEEQYRLIADNTADNIWIFDMDFNLQYVSPSVKKMKGFTVEEQLAMPLETTMTPASYAAVLQRFQEEMALEATGTADPGRTVTFETEEYCSDGSMIAVENSVTLIRDDQGRPVGILGISRDITGRKRVEAALRESAEQYRALVEGLPDIVMRFDCAGRHLFVSGNVRDMVDIPAPDFIGKTHAELGFPEAQCQFWEEAIRGVCDSGAPTEAEFTFAGRKGETIFNWRLNPEFDEQGAVTSVLSISRDITLHRQAERNYQTLFREMLDGFALHEIILDEEGEPVDYRFLAVNPAFERMTARRADEIVGRTVLDVFPGTERHWIETYGRVVLTGEPAFFHEYSAELAKYFEVTAFRPAPRQFACIFVDNTGRRQAEDALRLAHRKLRILSGITRHDILNQVMALEGFLALAGDLTSGPEQAGYLDQVGMAATAILRHSEFTRAYEELGLGQPAWFPVSDLVGKIGDRRLPLCNDCGEVSLYADPMIEKVFSNLLDNTLRHGTGATRVHLSCEESEDSLRLIWEDDGCGIPADQKERIFERGVGKNTGFGLLLSREILAITGITITETGEPSRGARFEMAVPDGSWRRVPPANAGHTD
jgi:PAS domain S-box-containing protein